MIQRPFLTGAAVGAVGMIVWWKRGVIAAFFRRITAHFHGALDADMPSALRQLRRYTFASMQDQSPIVGLTHASYAMSLLDVLEALPGGAAALSIDAGTTRRLIAALQDRHSAKLKNCDSYVAAETVEVIPPPQTVN